MVAGRLGRGGLTAIFLLLVVPLIRSAHAPHTQVTFKML